MFEAKVYRILEKLVELYDFLNEEKIRYLSAASFLIGVFLGYLLWGHEEPSNEKAPYDVRLKNNKHIEVVQEKGSLVYDFRPLGDGFYELRAVLDPKLGEKR